MDSLGQVSRYPHLIYRPAQTPNQAEKSGGYSSLSQLEKMTVFKNQETDLTIVTQEGDYVTISTDSEFRLDFTTYDQTGRPRGLNSRLHFETLSLESREEFTMSVQGDLNKQEIKDIQKVLQSLDKIMNDLLSGRLDKVMTRAGKLGDLDSLSGIDATLQLEQSLSAGSAVPAEGTSAPYPSTQQSEAPEILIGPNALELVQQKIRDTLHDRDLLTVSK